MTTQVTPLGLAAAGLDACVHCGFCLQACPTYVNLQDENDSPRGRLVLMRRMLEGEISLDDADAGTHLDRCLGCRACETACPSGVPYGQLLEATRATTRDARPIPIVARIVLGLFARRHWLTFALLLARAIRATQLPRILARVLPHRAAFPMAMLASTSPVMTGRRHASSDTLSHQADGGHAKQVAVLEGCVMRGLFSHTNAATRRVLQVNGYAVLDTPGQHCCGALHAHAGDLQGARALARRNIAAFEAGTPDFIAVNSAGCGAMLKEYGHLLDSDAAWQNRARIVAGKVRDVSELLSAAGPVAGAPLSARVTYDAPCHLMHAQRIVREPMSVLAAIPGMELVPLMDSDQCCGSAGIYNLIEPDTSDAVLAPKLRHIAETRATLVATGNPGCLMQIGAGLLQSGSSARAVHPVDILDASYALRAPTGGN